MPAVLRIRGLRYVLAYSVLLASPVDVVVIKFSLKSSQVRAVLASVLSDMVWVPFKSTSNTGVRVMFLTHGFLVLFGVGFLHMLCSEFGSGPRVPHGAGLGMISLIRVAPATLSISWENPT